ncbi:MAG: hypothetical protein DME26_10725 [Verrucomicrobia bacterium]|nr:MAG: hypothetical protein DME26_10725 [Verrucomicrobiota bacterium]
MKACRSDSKMKRLVPLLTSGPAGATTYSWTISNGTVTSATNIQTITYSAGASGNVGLTLRVSNASGCFATNSTNVTTVLPGSPPRLNISQLGTNVVLSWSNVFACYALQYTPRLVPPPATNSWTVHPGPFVPSGGKIYATNDIGATNRFFRLSF